MGKGVGLVAVGSKLAQGLLQVLGDQAIVGLRMDDKSELDCGWGSYAFDGCCHITVAHIDKYAAVSIVQGGSYEM